MDDKQAFLNKINEDRSNNFSFVNDKMLKNVYDKVVKKTFRINEGGQKQTPASTVEGKAQRVINADQNVKAAIQELVLSLAELGDKDIALQLLSGHIFFLNDIFKDFDKEEK